MKGTFFPFFYLCAFIMNLEHFDTNCQLATKSQWVGGVQHTNDTELSVFPFPGTATDGFAAG
jgi:hypothetical protein